MFGLKTSKKKIRLLFCMNHMIMGGVEKVLCQYLLLLSNSNKSFDITVICKEKIMEPFFIDFFQQNNIKLYDTFFSFYNKEKPFLIRFFYFVFFKAIWFYFKNRSDFIIDFANCSFYRELRGYDKKIIAWCHGSINVYERCLKKRLNCTKYKHVVFLSESVVKDISLRNKELTEKISCIYNPIDVDLIRKLSFEPIQVIPRGAYFVAVQRLNNFDKNVKTVIDAFNLFSRKNNSIKLYVVGDGPDKENLIKIAKDNPNIIFTGQLANPYPLIRHALALILSSTKTIGEGFPNTLLEAQALETLAISSDVKSGVEEILLNGDAGLLFEAENPISLEEKMSYVVSSPQDCLLKIKEATVNLSRFDVNVALKKMTNLFSE